MPLNVPLNVGAPMDHEDIVTMTAPLIVMMVPTLDTKVFQGDTVNIFFVFQ
jgi:hypothetical protein